MWWKYNISSIIFWFDSNKFYEGSLNFVATFSIKPSFSHQACKLRPSRGGEASHGLKTEDVFYSYKSLHLALCKRGNVIMSSARQNNVNQRNRCITLRNMCIVCLICLWINQNDSKKQLAQFVSTFFWSTVSRDNEETESEPDHEEREVEKINWNLEQRQ